MLSEKKNRKSISKIWLFLKIPKSIHNSTYCQRLDSKLYFSEIFDHFPQRIQLFLAREKKQTKDHRKYGKHSWIFMPKLRLCLIGIEHFGPLWKCFHCCRSHCFFRFSRFSFAPLFALPSRTFRRCSGWLGGGRFEWVALLQPWRCFMRKVTNAANTTRSRFIWTLAETGKWPSKRRNPQYIFGQTCLL